MFLLPGNLAGHKSPKFFLWPASQGNLPFSDLLKSMQWIPFLLGWVLMVSKCFSDMPMHRRHFDFIKLYRDACAFTPAAPVQSQGGMQKNRRPGPYNRKAKNKKPGC
jgi:hypothetical protein